MIHPCKDTLKESLCWVWGQRPKMDGWTYAWNVVEAAGGELQHICCFNIPSSCIWLMLFVTDREKLDNGELNELVCCSECPRCFCLECLKITKVVLNNKIWFGFNFEPNIPMTLVVLKAPKRSHWSCPVCRQNDKHLNYSGYESVDHMMQVIKWYLACRFECWKLRFCFSK